MKKRRLHARALKLWRNDYLTHKYLWPNIEWAASASLRGIGSRSPVVLDLGCGHKPYRDLFPTARYFGMDCGMVDSSPDFVGDALSLPVKDESVDIVFATQVIEHVTKPHQMVRECKRVLRPSGYLVLTGPFYWPLHEEPHDFFRFTKYGFSQLLADAGFSEWQIREDGGDWAQLMLNVSLRLTSRFFIPLICIVNIVGAFTDAMSASRKSPANYTVMAKV
jgi:SAM-dependent methyltransferase